MPRPFLAIGAAPITPPARGPRRVLSCGGPADSPANSVRRNLAVFAHTPGQSRSAAAPPGPATTPTGSLVLPHGQCHSKPPIPSAVRLRRASEALPATDLVWRQCLAAASIDDESSAAP